MDRYKKIVKVDKFSLITRTPLPRSNKPKYLSLELSFDNYSKFLSQILGKETQLPLLETEFYDEDIISTDEEFYLRYNFLKVINELNFISVTFNLSDSTLPAYNAIMKKIGWKHKEITKLKMTLDRNPVPLVRRNLRLESAQGKLLIPEEKLLWCSPATLSQLNGKVDDRVLKDAIKLKDIVFQYYSRLNQIYRFEQFTEFDKVWLAYDFIKRHIKFAGEATRVIDGREVRYNPNGINDWVSQPLGTYEHKRGICEGQARLFQVLLNNPYIKSDTVVINGECSLGSHTWAGTVIDDKLYQTCLTMGGVFKDLEKMRYIPDNKEIYPQIYPTATLNDYEINKIQAHVRSLKK